MEVLIGLITAAVFALFFIVWRLSKRINEKTFLIVEDDGKGNKKIKNHKGEIILEI